MDDLKAALTAAGYESFTPVFDGQFHILSQPKVHFFIGWEVRDDYGNLIQREAKYSIDRAIENFVEPQGDPLAFTDSLKEKIVNRRTEFNQLMVRGISPPEERVEPPIPEEGQEEHDFIPVPAHVTEAWNELGLVLTERGSPVNNADNALRVIEGTEAFQGRIWFDEFANTIATSFGSGDEPEREWTDHDTRALWLEFQRRMGICRIGKEAVLEAVFAYAYSHRRHPVKLWLAQTRWDGIPRIQTFLRDYMSAEDNAFTRAISTNFFVSMMARVFQPGCKVDNMLVLEGDQGARKSSALKALCGNWFTECNEPLSNGNNKDFYSVLQGKMLVEIAELDSFSRADIKRIKAIITTANDRYRPAYGRLAQNFPRTSVFVGTTNEDEYLEDPTGGRRFWPVKAGQIRLEEIERDRAQLFAEAYARYRARASWWEVPRELALAAQEERRKTDAWEGIIDNWLRLPRMEPVTTQAVLEEALKIDPERMDRYSQMRVAYCLKILGFKNKLKKQSGSVKRVWVKE